MIQVFSKSLSEPITINTPFRVLVLDTDVAGQWHVVLGEGIEWGREMGLLDSRRTGTGMEMASSSWNWSHRLRQSNGSGFWEIIIA